ncbi:ATP synthase subunit f, mitochondrial [Galemys pyrenaicus]|uniref:ATP synthase F(0) complex subunit f, mitochondrial n=1 Tax=Galemys pyrenaicus TaxID=202257 RepID=A0A8J5ZYL2_GALPY|nr:ATP synthase subunit f, mitochondrial [Galemys pyrenaicus]
MSSQSVAVRYQGAERDRREYLRFSEPEDSGDRLMIAFWVNCLPETEQFRLLRSVYLGQQWIVEHLEEQSLKCMIVNNDRHSPPSDAPLTSTVDTQGSKWHQKKLLDVKLGDLPGWILTGDFTSKSVTGAFQRGYYQYYNKYFHVKKGNKAGISVALAAEEFINHCPSYKELKQEQLH